MRRVASILVLLLAAVADAAPPVSLELATEKNFPLTGAQQWSRLLADAGVTNFRIRSATGTDRPLVEKFGNEKNPSYRVVGMLTARNELVLPGGKFSSRDAAGIRNWLETLADQGEAGVTERRSAFGLIGKDLLAVQEDLQQAVDFSTSGVSLTDALKKMESRLDYPLVIDPAAKQEIEQVTIADNLSGVSAGTALAAMLRPAGLVLAPERPRGGTVQYRVAKPVEGKESWPIGWPPEKKPIDILPALYEFINVEISETPVQEAVDAIAERLQVPFLYDRNAMAWHEIDLTKVDATVPGKRSTYSLILQKVLRQAMMKPELKLDDAGKPFYWVTTIKPIGR